MDKALEVYMDYNATSPVRQEAMDAFNDAVLSGYGNPGSAHCPQHC